jgi:Stage II sporulation protein E (SpoIIE)
MRKAGLLWLGVALIAATPLTRAQVDATQWPSGLVTLSDGWLEHDGDNPAWAQANFNDRGWTPVELDDLGAAQPGRRWYRVHVKLAPGHPPLDLLLAGGEGTYELFIDGKQQAGPGLRQLRGVKRPTEQVFSLEGEGTDLVLALRTSAPTGYTGWHLPLFLTAALGTPGAIENERAALQSQRLYAALPSIAINLVLMLAGIGAFALYRSQRKHAEYLWLGLYLFLLGTSNVLLDCATSGGVLSLAWNNLLADPLIYVITILQIEFTFSFAGRQVSRVWRAYEWALLTPLIFAGLSEMGRFSSSAYILIETTAIMPAALLLPVLLFVWYRKGNREAGWLILPSLLPAAAVGLFNVGSASIFTGWGRLDFLADPILAGPVPLQISDLGDLLFVLAIGVVMFHRFTSVSREQARSAAELTAAREIQRRLVPEHLPEMEGYELEAAYFPAEEVGGDFYQVLETKGATLVVVGDVSGKGLKAAMTGTLALGALRALATEGLGPGGVLGRLNRQLAETGNEGFVTCLCARLGERGEVTVANAGHLPPYRNGEELLLEANLPLGIAPDEEYGEHGFRLEEGDRLTLLSDGVVEARDAGGELFGFERTRRISAETATAIAEAALRFGQADDITVLTLTRMRDANAPMRAHAAALVGFETGLG